MYQFGQLLEHNELGFVQFIRKENKFIVSFENKKYIVEENTLKALDKEYVLNNYDVLMNLWKDEKLNVPFPQFVGHADAAYLLKINNNVLIIGKTHTGKTGNIF